jgi:cytoskeletal protein RodZ
LHEARQARGVDLREAAQQTRIGMQYLKALEEENFSKLPGEVFVRGFLKNYAKYLHLDEADVLKRYADLTQKKPVVAAPPPVELPQAAPAQAPRPRVKIPVEPLLWGAAIVVILVLFLFTGLPRHHSKETRQSEMTSPSGNAELSTAPVPTAGKEKLYLEVVALENTWLLVRTDASPQKKAVLNKGDSLIWSADERFLLSYGSAGALKLLLNGQELVVNEPKNAVVRDLMVISSGIVDRKIQPERPRPVKPKSKPTVSTPPQAQSKPSVTAAGQQPASEPPPPPKKQRLPAPQGPPFEPPQVPTP